MLSFFSKDDGITSGGGSQFQQTYQVSFVPNPSFNLVEGIVHLGHLTLSDDYPQYYPHFSDDELALNFSSNGPTANQTGTIVLWVTQLQHFYDHPLGAAIGGQQFSVSFNGGDGNLYKLTSVRIDTASGTFAVPAGGSGTTDLLADISRATPDIQPTKAQIVEGHSVLLDYNLKFDKFFFDTLALPFPFRIGVYRSATSTFDVGTAERIGSLVDVPLRDLDNRNSLEVDHGSSFHSVKIDVGQQISGTRARPYVFVVADPPSSGGEPGVIGRVQESDETNNSILATGSAITKPDIQILTANADSSTKISFTYGVQNDPGRFTAGLYRSADTTFNPDPKVDVPIASQPIEPNQPPGAFLLPSPLKPDPTRPYLLVVADPPSSGFAHGLVEESDETNNVAATLVPSSNPTVTPTPVTTPVVPTPAVPLFVSDYTILSFGENRGGNKTSNGDLEIRYQYRGGGFPTGLTTGIAVYWARGENIIPVVIATRVLEKTKGIHTFPLPISSLDHPPVGATRLVAVLRADDGARHTVALKEVASFNPQSKIISHELTSNSPYNAPAAPTRYERVRLWIRRYADIIISTSKQFNVSAIAVAGTIAWEALQNPRTVFRFKGSGPGKVHEHEYFVKPAASELVEGTYKYGHFIPRPPFTLKGFLQKHRLLHTPEGAALYIAAILNAYSVEAEKSGIPIRTKPGILASYYVGEGGFELRNAEAGFRTRAKTIAAHPLKAGTTMGQWVEHNDLYLKSALGLF